MYIKGLPMSATPAILDEEFKKFGPIKPNGIQVRNNRVCFNSVHIFCTSLCFFTTPKLI